MRGRASGTTSSPSRRTCSSASRRSSRSPAPASPFHRRRFTWAGTRASTPSAGEKAEQEVAAWRRPGRLPFPRFPAGTLERLAGRLHYPPRGSPDFHATEEELAQAGDERLSAEPLSARRAGEAGGADRHRRPRAQVMAGSGCDRPGGSILSGQPARRRMGFGRAGRMGGMMEIARAAILGGGVIGAGWPARLIQNGIDVAVYDPDPEAERKIGEVMANAERAYAKLTLRAAHRPRAHGGLARTRWPRRSKAPSYRRRRCPERLRAEAQRLAEIERHAPQRRADRRLVDLRPTSRPTCRRRWRIPSG